MKEEWFSTAVAMVLVFLVFRADAQPLPAGGTRLPRRQPLDKIMANSRQRARAVDEATRAVLKDVRTAPVVVPDRTDELAAKVRSLRLAPNRSQVDFDQLSKQVDDIKPTTREETYRKQALSAELQLAETSRLVEQTNEQFQQVSADYEVAIADVNDLQGAVDAEKQKVADVANWLWGTGSALIVTALGYVAKFSHFRLDRKLKKLEIRIKTVQALRDERLLGAAGERPIQST